MKTVLDYDRIMVLEAGKILELDQPRVLISKHDGLFREMCRASADWRELQAMADER